MDWHTCLRLGQLCEENNCVIFYDKGGHAPPVVLLYRSSRCVLSMKQQELKEYELLIYAHELTNPDWVSLSVTIKEFATSCSIRDCFN